MQHFYDGQIRRYITQIVRMFSDFAYKDGDGKIVKVPVTYGDLTRQVASIIRDNSENKIPSAPRMAVYVTSIEMDTARLADASYVSKLNIRERAFDSNNNEYLNEQGKNYTVERLMPTPYTLGVNVDIWSTNTDQKLQIMEQILMLFNPSLEIQTTDNYIDWTSLSVVNLTGTTWSSRSVPVGAESEIDIATLNLETPIYISPPSKVKKLGVITDIVMNVNDTSRDVFGEILEESANVKVNIGDFHLFVIGNTATILERGARTGADNLTPFKQSADLNWRVILDQYPGQFKAGLSTLYLKIDETHEVVGQASLNPLTDNELTINWDADTFPSNTVIESPIGVDRGTIDAIVDPQKSGPGHGLPVPQTGTRYLIIGEGIGGEVNEDGPDAWKNTDGTDFVAKPNQIIEWDGDNWHIIFDGKLQSTIYVTNTFTGVQYKWNGEEFVLSVSGEYGPGEWRLEL